MNTEAEAADLVLRIVIDSTAYFFKMAASLSEPLRKKAVDAIYRALYSKGIGKENPDMKALIQWEEGICVFQLAEKDCPVFDQAAKKLGIKYVPVESQEAPDAKDRMTMIICSGGDAQLVNGILLQNKLHGRDLVQADPAPAEVIEKPEAPTEQVETAQEAVQSGSMSQSDTFKAYYQVNRAQGDPEAVQEAGEENPTQAAEPMSGSPSATGSTIYGFASSSEGLDIEALSSAIEMDPPQNGRFSVRERLREIKGTLEKDAPSQGTVLEKSAVQESVEQQLKSQLAGNIPQIGE